MSLTIAQFPKCYDDDMLHPNVLGMKIMAEAWYRCLAGPNAKKAVIDKLHAKKYDVKTITRDYFRSRRVGNGINE